MEAYWEQTGLDLKPTVPCDDLDGLNPDAPDTRGRAPETDHSHVGDGGSVSDPPMTLAEAQAKYDPNNDPYTLIGQEPDGSIVVVSIATAIEPPAWVKTPEDLSQWVAQVDAVQAKESGQHK